MRRCSALFIITEIQSKTIGHDPPHQTRKSCIASDIGTGTGVQATRPCTEGGREWPWSDLWKEYLAAATRVLYGLHSWPHHHTSWNPFHRDMDSHHKGVSQRYVAKEIHCSAVYNNKKGE